MIEAVTRLGEALSDFGESVLDALYRWTWWDTMIVFWYGLMLFLILTHLQSTP